jgi:hypothetical protein
MVSGNQPLGKEGIMRYVRLMVFIVIALAVLSSGCDRTDIGKMSMEGPPFPDELSKNFDEAIFDQDHFGN